MKTTLAVVLLATTLVGCSAPAVFDPRACPREQAYTKEEQQRILAELPAAGPTVRSAMTDYGKLRDKARACRGVR